MKQNWRIQMIRRGIKGTWPRLGIVRRYLQLSLRVRPLHLLFGFSESGRDFRELGGFQRVGECRTFREFIRGIFRELCRLFRELCRLFRELGVFQRVGPTLWKSDQLSEIPPTLWKPTNSLKIRKVGEEASGSLLNNQGWSGGSVKGLSRIDVNDRGEEGAPSSLKSDDGRV